MRLTDYLEPELVLLDLRTRGVDDTLHAFVERLADSGRVNHADQVERALADRESTHTTSLGNGVALPHATIAGLDRPLILVGVSPEGVPFGPDDAEAPPERLFFVLLSPENQAGTHIKLLARIVRLVRIPEFVDSLVGAGSGAALIDRIERVDAQHV